MSFCFNSTHTILVDTIGSSQGTSFVFAFFLSYNGGYPHERTYAVVQNGNNIAATLLVSTNFQGANPYDLTVPPTSSIEVLQCLVYSLNSAANEKLPRIFSLLETR